MFGMIALILVVFAMVVFVIGKIHGPDPVEVPVEAPLDPSDP